MSDATPQTPEGLPPRAPRWMKIALVVSLAINLAVIGLVAGAAVNFRKDGGPQSGRIDGPNP
ncbi:MAG: putative membrane protein, partial [Dinoroseobacter sp.]